MLRRVGAWRRNAISPAPWQALRAHWLSGSASTNADGQSETTAWSLVQREGTRRTTAAGGGSGGVSLDHCYEEHPPSSSGSGGGKCEEAAPRFSLAGLKQATLSQLQVGTALDPRAPQLSPPALPPFSSLLPIATLMTHLPSGHLPAQRLPA